jgi:hypothetical protein
MRRHALCRASQAAPYADEYCANKQASCSIANRWATVCGKWPTRGGCGTGSAVFLQHAVARLSSPLGIAHVGSGSKMTVSALTSYVGRVNGAADEKLPCLRSE